MTTSVARRLLPIGMSAVLVVGCGGSDDSSEGTSTGDSTATSAATTVPALLPTTPAATGDVDEVTWALYREPNSLDPIFAFDYPENTVLTTMCDALLQQQPDGTIEPGLAELTRLDDTTMVLTLRDGTTFWDGSPLTAEDAVFSLQRQSDPQFGGFYGAVFDRVESIEATGPLEVTIRLSEADYWLEGELSSMPGIVVSKAFVEAAGETFGTPSGGVMCTGAFELEQWSTGDRVTVTANDEYWGGAPKVATIDFIGVPDESTLSAGLLAGDLDGNYAGALPTLDQLQSSPSLSVRRGPSYAASALIVSTQEGPLGDAGVRKALSLAIDRQGLIDTVYKGAAQLPRTIANPGSWGYGQDVFQAGWDALEAPVVDVEQGAQLVEEAGMTGETIVLGTTNEIASIATTANAIKSAAESIGLELELQAVSAANYINYFIDAQAREGVDGFVTVNYPDYADPAALYSTFVMENGSQNYSGYTNPEVTRLMNEARATADLDARAQLVVEAQAIIMDELPWIGLVLPDTVLVTSAELTGAPSSFVYMNSPWAATLGAVG